MKQIDVKWWFFLLGGAVFSPSPRVGGAGVGGATLSLLSPLVWCWFLHPPFWCCLLSPSFWWVVLFPLLLLLCGAVFLPLHCGWCCLPSPSFIVVPPPCGAAAILHQNWIEHRKHNTRRSESELTDCLFFDKLLLHFCFCFSSIFLLFPFHVPVGLFTFGKVKRRNSDLNRHSVWLAASAKQTLKVSLSSPPPSTPPHTTHTHTLHSSLHPHTHSTPLPSHHHHSFLPPPRHTPPPLLLRLLLFGGFLADLGLCLCPSLCLSVFPKFPSRYVALNSKNRTSERRGIGHVLFSTYCRSLMGKIQWSLRWISGASDSTFVIFRWAVLAMRDEPNNGLRCSSARSSDTIKGCWFRFMCSPLRNISSEVWWTSSLRGERSHHKVYVGELAEGPFTHS